MSHFPGREPAIAWMRAGTLLFTAQASALDERGLRAPSRLDGWSRAHVIAHVARNAEGLARLASWARTGVRTPMYAGPEQRNADIETTAVHDLDTLLTDLAGTNTILEEGLAALTGPRWEYEVEMRGRAVPAAVIPWLRAREAWLHAVDLGTGVELADLPDDLLDALLEDVAGSREGVPPITLAPSDRGTTLDVRGGGTQVTGTTAALVGWLTGRPTPDTVTSPDGVPALPPWL